MVGRTDLRQDLLGDVTYQGNGPVTFLVPVMIIEGFEIVDIYIDMGEGFIQFQATIDFVIDSHIPRQRDD